MAARQFSALRLPMNSLLLALALLASGTALAASSHCGKEGVWIEILGAGTTALDGQAASSFLIWEDNAPRMLVDVGDGSKQGFEKSGATLNGIEVIALTQVQIDHAGDLGAYLIASAESERAAPLTILGPDSNQSPLPSTSEFMQRLIGANGLYPQYADALTSRSSPGNRLRIADVPATGSRRWARYASDSLRLAAIPVNHGDIPALAWRVEIGVKTIVFSGDFNNVKNAVGKFAKDADALVVSHVIPEISRGALREKFALPSQLGRVAAQANARMMILASRSERTRGRESLSRQAIEQSYDGPLLFANDGECWGL